MIALDQVSKSYRKGKLRIEALKAVTFTIAPREFVALMGPSGSGKSTLLNLIGALDRADAGLVRVDGEEIGSLGERARTAWRGRHVGFIFQRHHLIPVLTAAQNVELPLLLHKMAAAERRRRVDNVLNLVGLGQRASHLPRELSGGQEQRVSIARALVSDPELILCDEPTGNLDSESGTAILNMLAALNTQFHKTILIVTHSEEAAAAADRVIHLRDGMISEPAATS